MRYIGNKTKLLGFIGDFLDAHRIEGGRALDAFAGTAVVGHYLKARGFAVTTCDIMTYSYVFQRAYVVANGYPRFRGLASDPEFRAARPAVADALTARSDAARGRPERDAARPLEEVLVYLDSYLEPEPGFLTAHFSAPAHGRRVARATERMYFTRDNAMRIDAIRRRLHRWRAASLITDDEYYVLLAALIEAADAVANTTGVYAAFVKSWQSNARRPLRLRPGPPTNGAGVRGEAHQRDVGQLIDDVGPVELLYLDPPYNARQYAGYYHIPELLARGWFDGAPALRGKTGLIPDGHLRSPWSSRARCVGALEALVQRARATHVLMSYNSEGIIPEREIGRIFRRYGVASTYERAGRRYARYRSDSDSAQRRYKGDSVVEYLYYVCLRPPRGSLRSEKRESERERLTSEQ